MSCTQIAKFGIMHVPSGRHVFPGLTVRENLEVGTINWRGSFGAFSSELSREEVVLDEYHYRYADELIARAKGIIDRLDSYK